MLPVLQLGPLAIPVPAITIIIGLWIGMNLAERGAYRFGIKSENLINLLLSGLGSGLVAARLGYIVRYPAAFMHNFWDVLSRNPGLLDPFIGLFTGGLVAFIYGQRKHLPLLKTLDALTPFFAVLSISISTSNLFSGNAYGIPAELPWSIELLGSQRHPTQLYELITGIVILIIVLLGQNRKKFYHPGVSFTGFMMLSAGTRIFWEAFRATSPTTLHGIRTAQAVAWIILAASIPILYQLRKQTQQSKQMNGEHNE